METLLYLSLGLNLILLTFLCRSYIRKKLQEHKTTRSQPAPETPPQPRPIVNAQLRTIAETCEAKLAEEDRGKVKLLVHYQDKEHLAILQIGELMISLRRNNENQSLFKINSFMEALTLAKYGYDGTARYIPVPAELESILAQRHIINVYLEALGLEKISEKEDFWCVDTETGWNTGWKRFNCDVNEAFSRLHCKSRVRTSESNYLHQTEHEEFVNLLLLLKGWEYLFIEV